MSEERKNRDFTLIMGTIRLSRLVSLFYFANRLLLLQCDGQRLGVELEIRPAGNVIVWPGERIQANCSTEQISTPFSLKWERKDPDNSTIFQQHRIDKRTQSLLIPNAQPRVNGIYLCILEDSRNVVHSKPLQIIVKGTLSDESVTIKHQRKLPCEEVSLFCNKSPSIPISCSKLCDGVPDCINGADERECPDEPCRGKFRCNTKRCVDYSRVCDPEGFDDCGDMSDEQNCPGSKKSTPKTTVSVDADMTKDDDDESMMWLKTTVYTVIACTVGIVLLISIVVIAIFRIKMKRAAERRALRHAERRRRQTHRCENHSNQSSSRARRNDAVEHEPFISAPSPTHYGNIIVNVNNGVQYVPSAEFNTILQAPPPYSEVITENRNDDAIGRHSPPPEYSTIDRNPNRTSQLCPETEESPPLQSNGSGIVNNSSNINNCANNSNTESVTNSMSHNDMQLFEEREGETQFNRVRPSQRSSTPPPRLSRLPTGSLNRMRNDRGRDGRQPRNVRSVGSALRPKQLKVMDGQIVLDDNSSGSSSPETVNRNTQTNPADISNSNNSSQNGAKPAPVAQIQVQSGQIVLATGASELAESSSHSPESSSQLPEEASTCSVENAQGQGELEVKDGQIVFKSSAS
ncbi:uncharacterized protein LOC128232230 isoform X2 [Mya arenaria]|uniref:uncharacterized protein LOC128232230 isoform X2 n=1 Tax=Mya arenaria TaxID=6604 RepID=UPI0022E867FF|nr:uncharacterized protein LOC128232230 isoform X2 [Mya arenaria]